MKFYSDLPFDIVHEMCALASVDSKLLASLSMVSKTTRTAAIPFLFRTIKWTQQWGEKDVAWSGADAKVQVLLDNKDILDAVRKFYFYPWVYKATDAPIPTAFFSLMMATTKLKALELVLQPEYLNQVKNEIGMLPSVESLILPSPPWLVIIKSCPNLTGLEIDHDESCGRPDYVEWTYASIAESHRGLIKLHVPKSPTTDEITEIAKTFPDIEELGLLGRIGHRYTPHEEGKSVLVHLPSFTMLRKLKSLYLTDLSSLGLGYNPPWCGNAYRQKGVRERVAKEWQDALDRIVKGVEESVICGEEGKRGCPLERLVLGRSSYSRGTIFVTEGKGKLQLLADH